MVNQDELLNRIDNATMDTFPHTLMLLGEYGSGKHMLCDYIAKHFNLTLCDLTETLDLETIERTYTRSEPYIYIINTKNITIREQNVILKFIEEPLKNAFIILLCEDINQLLETVRNRCQIWTLNKYSKEVLKQFTDNDLILKFANTPGEVSAMKDEDLQGMIELSNKIVKYIGQANYANALTISNKIAFNNEKDRYPIDIFMKVLLYIVEQSYVDNHTLTLFNIFVATNVLYNDMKVSHVNKAHLFENYISQIWGISRDGN